MGLKTIDGSMFREMLTSCCTYLNNNREGVDALNVLPVSLSFTLNIPFPSRDDMTSVISSTSPSDMLS